jgi:DNA-binding MarR family transcriptional regulator
MPDPSGSDPPGTAIGTTMAKNCKLIARIQKQRDAIGDGLPIYDSLIGFNIFLVLCQYEALGEAPRLKDIHQEIGRSQGGVRRLIRLLAADGWVTLETSNGDMRSRCVVPTPRLKAVIAKFLLTTGKTN